MKVAILTPFSVTALLSEAEIKARGLKLQHTQPWVSNLAEALVKQGINVHVVTISNEYGENLSIRKNNVVYNFLKASGKFRRGLTFFESERFKIHRFLRDEGFDIVHGQGFNSFGYYTVTSRIPNILTMHLYKGIKDLDWSAPISIFIGIILSFQKWRILKSAKNVISISPQVRNILEQKKLQVHIFDIENAVRKT